MGYVLLEELVELDSLGFVWLLFYTRKELNTITHTIDLCLCDTYICIPRAANSLLFSKQFFGGGV